MLRLRVRSPSAPFLKTLREIARSFLLPIVAGGSDGGGPAAGGLGVSMAESVVRRVDSPGIQRGWAMKAGLFGLVAALLLLCAAAVCGDRGRRALDQVN